MAQHALTTVDNPFDPFTQWDEWLSYDRANHHNSVELLAQFSIYSDELSEADQDLAVEEAIDFIISEDPDLKFKKVSKKEKK